MTAATLHLSPRERELTRLVGNGLSDREIAHELGLAPGTIKVYMAGMHKKLFSIPQFSRKSNCRVAVALLALSLGLTQPPEPITLI